jgi:hypothetical protein
MHIQGVAEAECRAAVEAAEAAYASALDPKVTADEEALLATHQRALKAAHSVFHSAAAGDPQASSLTHTSNIYVLHTLQRCSSNIYVLHTLQRCCRLVHV